MPLLSPSASIFPSPAEGEGVGRCTRLAAVFPQRRAAAHVGIELAFFHLAQIQPGALVLGHNILRAKIRAQRGGKLKYRAIAQYGAFNAVLGSHGGESRAGFHRHRAGERLGAVT